MDPAMKERVDAARKASERAKDMDGGEFPPDPPPGIYEGRLQTCKVFVSAQAGRPMLQRCFVIEGGESHGMQARDFLNLEQDFLIARMRAFVESCGYEMPDDLFDYEACEREDTWVFVPDLVDTMSAIEGENREYKFEFKQRPGRDGRVFNSISVIEVGPVEDGAPKKSAKKEEPADEEPADETPSEPEDGDDDEVLRTELLAFCVDEGNVEGVEDGMSLDDVKEKIGEYVFWPDTIDEDTLHAVDGLEDESPSDGVSADAIDLLIRAGLEDSVVKVEAPKRKPRSRKKK